jgi:pimeloyl-ACP methyl ester carboxylesterase
MQLIDWPRALIDELVRRDYRVIIFDNRDVGHSTKFDAAGLPDNAAVTAALTAGQSAPIAYGLRDMARDALGLLDALGIARAHIVGASMGGNIGQYMAIDAPARVRSLVTVGSDDANPALPVIADPAAFAALPPAPAPDDTAAYVEYQTQVRLVLAGTGFPADADSVRAQVRRGVERAYDPAGLQRQQMAALVDRYEPDHYRLEHLAAIRVPTVVLQGADDPLQPLETARDLASRIPGAELRIIPGMGHDIPPQLAPVIADAVVAAASRASAVPK